MIQDLWLQGKFRVVSWVAIRFADWALDIRTRQIARTRAAWEAEIDAQSRIP